MGEPSVYDTRILGAHLVMPSVETLAGIHRDAERLERVARTLAALRVYQRSLNVILDDTAHELRNRGSGIESLARRMKLSKQAVVDRLNHAARRRVAAGPAPRRDRRAA